MSPTRDDLRRLREIEVDSDDRQRLAGVRAAVRRAQRRRRAVGVAAAAVTVAAVAVVGGTQLGGGHGAPAELEMSPTSHPTATGRPTHDNGAGTTAAATSPTRSTPTSTSTSTSAAPSASTAPAVVVSTCPTSQLRVTVGMPGGAAGSAYYPLEFQNVGATACRLTGYPGVSFLSGDRQQIGQPADRQPPTASAVSLAPRGYAHATLRVVNAHNYPASSCQPQTASWLRVFPPDNVDAVLVSHQFLVCSSRSSTSITAVLPGRGAS